MESSSMTPQIIQSTRTKHRNQRDESANDKDFPILEDNM